MVLTMMQLGFPTAHRLTFLSSPPVTSTRPDLWPSARQLTLELCAANSSVEGHGGGVIQGSAWNGQQVR